MENRTIQPTISRNFHFSLIFVLAIKNFMNILHIQRTFEEIQEVHRIARQTTHIVKLRISDTTELGNFLRTSISTIPGIISIQTEVVLETYKETAKIPIS